ncbi:MAG: lipid-A-disaccharide synthase [Magnetovibrio sp.]|nr:lipid-A-disaccharide synthase [Magnetovibrio sp.]
MNGSESAPLIYIVAGEPSADLLGARLMAALKAETMGTVEFAGIGGDAMQAEGLDSLFPMDELAVMGLAEVLPRLPRLVGRISETVADVRARAPAALVTIDSPDFNFRVARKLKGAGTPLIHFVAPSVWAWRPGRAAKIARFLDHLLVLLPFEPPYFEAEGLATTYVGHPVLEGPAAAADGARFRERHGIAAADKVLMMLPGSRRSEAERLLPVFETVVAEMAERFAGLRVLTVAASPTRELLGRCVAEWPVPVTLVDGDAQKFDAFAAADAALAASGTVALELAITGTPSVIAYRVNPLTAWLARRLITVRHVNLVNIILGRGAVPEFLAGECRAETIAPAVAELLSGGENVTAQKSAYTEALDALGRGGEPASRRAARAVLGVIGRT